MLPSFPLSPSFPLAAKRLVLSPLPSLFPLTPTFLSLQLFPDLVNTFLDVDVLNVIAQYLPLVRLVEVLALLQVLGRLLHGCVIPGPRTHNTEDDNQEDCKDPNSYHSWICEK